MEPVISVQGVVKRFRDHRGNPITVLDGVTFDVEQGETVVVMGGSGCGKSTLLNCLIAEYAVDEGNIIYRLKGQATPVEVARAAEESSIDTAIATALFAKEGNMALLPGRSDLRSVPRSARRRRESAFRGRRGW